MLFELRGIACVLNVKPIKEGFTKVQVIGSKTIKKTGEVARDISGARWINLSGGQADWWASKGDEMKHAIVSVVADAVTDSYNDKFFENYRAIDFDIIAWPDKAKGIKTTLMGLSGTGRILNIRPVSEGFTKIQVINSEKYKEKENTCTRWLSINGNLANWYTENANKVKGATVQFRTKAVTDTKTKGDDVKYFDSYRSDKCDIVVWAKSKQDSNQGVDTQQQYAEYDEPPMGFAEPDLDVEAGQFYQDLAQYNELPPQ
ncbi:hypothetical protein [Vibrio crassostreae]|uniref:hypothetical protein n=1 Tax=Vibrio crassostreae TaxID=246167 RepID=UPI001B317F22|nr:hypothetical protein [Vibrio crassostreae]